MKKGAGRMTVMDSITLYNEHCETFLMETNNKAWYMLISFITKYRRKKSFEEEHRLTHRPNEYRNKGTISE
jgi:hypothetical protein